MSGLAKLIKYSRAYKREYLTSLLYSVLNKLFDIMPEVLIGIAVDTVVRQQNSWLAQLGLHDVMHQLIVLGSITLVIWCLESLTQYKYAVGWRNLGQTIQHNLRIDAYTHLQKLPLTFFEGRKSGNLLAILNDDINQLERFIENGINEIIQVVISTFVIGVIFFYISPVLACLAIVPIPFLIWGSFYFQGKLAPRFLEVREKAGEINSRLANNILGIFTIKCFNTEIYETNNIIKDSEAYRVANKRAIAYSSIVTPVIRMGVLLGFLATLIYGGYLTTTGSIAVGSFSLLVFLTQRLLWPLTDLADTTILYQKSMAAASRALSLLEETIPEYLHDHSAKIKKNFAGEITIEHLSFGYNYESLILNDISFVVPAGSRLAIVGNTGSGKTTLIKLLMGFYKPTAGQIKIDDVDVNLIDSNVLRQTIGIVSQDIYLFHGSIIENIAYGIDNPDLSKVVEAAKQAQIHDFIMSLPNGYNTIIAERGQNLSGGQRQRLAIARAIMRNPKILILDEATSAVDNETEYAIQASIDCLAKDRTILVIAHRLSTVRNTDKILVLDNGTIIESGRHKDLLARKGMYHRLWQIQTGERIEA